MKKTLILFIASSLILFCPNTCLANNTINTRHSYNLNTAEKTILDINIKKSTAKLIAAFIILLLKLLLLIGKKYPNL